MKHGWKITDPLVISDSYGKSPFFLIEKLTINFTIFNSYLKLPDGKSHQIPSNLHFPMVFLWFPLRFSQFNAGFPSDYTDDTEAVARRATTALGWTILAKSRLATAVPSTCTKYPCNKYVTNDKFTNL